MTTLEVEMHYSFAHDRDSAKRGIEGNEMRRLASESTPVKHEQNFATSTGTPDREEMSEL